MNISRVKEVCSGYDGYEITELFYLPRRSLQNKMEAEVYNDFQHLGNEKNYKTTTLFEIS